MWFFTVGVHCDKPFQFRKNPTAGKSETGQEGIGETHVGWQGNEEGETYPKRYSAQGDTYASRAEFFSSVIWSKNRAMTCVSNAGAIGMLLCEPRKTHTHRSRCVGETLAQYKYWRLLHRMSRHGRNFDVFL